MLPLRIGMLACAAAACLLRGPLGEANALRRQPGARFLPDERLARLFALGQRSTCADVLWLNAMGDLSRDFGDKGKKRRWLDSVFAATTRLEPTFETVYSWGATYLGLLEQDPQRAIALLEKGVAANPGDIKLHVELAMAYFEYRKDRDATLAALDVVIKDPRCDALTMGFYDSLKVDARADFAALALWAPWLDDPNAEVRESAELYLERAKKRIALRAANDFSAEHGRPVRTPAELRDPALMAPEVYDAVLGALRIELTGRLTFPRLDELEQKHQVRGATAWVRNFRENNGRLPTLDELLQNRWIRLATPPPGQHFAIDEDGVHLADD